MEWQENYIIDPASSFELECLLLVNGLGIFCVLLGREERSQVV